MSATAVADVLLDCRWLPIGGAGRVTELLLRGLAEAPPDPPWTLWGPPGLASLAWPGARVVPFAGDPRRFRGQRCWFDLPPSRMTVFLHHQRPLRQVPSVTVIHDTIQLRHSPRSIERRARRAFLQRVGAVSSEVITVSAYSKKCIHRDLGVSENRITVLPPPADPARAARLVRLREQLPRADRALYVGNFLPHKNLDRLAEAFAGTQFAASGGRLVLVGGSAAETPVLRERLDRRYRGVVEVRGRAPEPELDRLMATSRLLVQPSLDEGFGLPVAEALACGLPVCASTAGALPEVTGGEARHFRPGSIEEMRTAIDESAEASRHSTTAARRPPVGSLAAFARGYQQVVDKALSRC